MENIKLFRITVDSRIPPDLIRLAISRISDEFPKFVDRKTNKIKITDRLDLWGQEKELIISQNNFMNELAAHGFNIYDKSLFKWDKLVEGQVFLAGNIQVVERPSEDKYTADPKNMKKIYTYYFDPEEKFNIVRIDSHIKNDIRRLYFSTLRGARQVTKQKTDNKGRQ